MVGSTLARRLTSPLLAIAISIAVLWWLLGDGTGEALIKAAEQFEEFKDDLDFAIFLRKLDALEETTRTKTTLVLDPGTPPYDLLRFDKKKDQK